MRTPIEYSKNLKNHVITMQMLLDCLYSSNKRAKNWRDKEREWRSCRYDEYDNESKARDKKEEYYGQKETMLSVLKPVCIHRETIYNQRRERIYDYEDEYEECLTVEECKEFWDCCNKLDEYKMPTLALLLDWKDFKRCCELEELNEYRKENVESEF